MPAWKHPTRRIGAAAVKQQTQQLKQSMQLVRMLPLHNGKHPCVTGRGQASYTGVCFNYNLSARMYGKLQCMLVRQFCDHLAA
jgi:hypothetical protein